MAVWTSVSLADANTIRCALYKLSSTLHSLNADCLPLVWGRFNSGKDATGPEYGAANGNGLAITSITGALEDTCDILGVPFFAT